MRTPTVSSITALGTTAGALLVIIFILELSLCLSSSEIIPRSLYTADLASYHDNRKGVQVKDKGSGSQG